MKYRLVFIAGFLASSFWAACNCGQGQGAPCNTTSDCPSGQVCSAGTCTGGGDGGPQGDGGQNGSDGGRTDGGQRGDGGQNGGGDGGCVNLQCQQVTCSDGGTTTVTGKVYDPSGQVPLYNALVYVPNGPVKPITNGVTCDQCGALTTGSPLVLDLTGPDGTFTLKNVPAGNNIPLVLQIGKWRRQVTLPAVQACNNNSVTDANLLRMPRNKLEGDIPQMAIASGNADPFECLLRKMGISDSEFTPPTGNGRIHYYVSNGNQLATTAPPASDLWSDAGTLMKYDVVILPCEGGENLGSKPTSVRQNIVDYTSAGGRLFTTHYGYVWMAYGPQPFPSTANWQPDPKQNTNPPDPFNVTVNQGFPKGAAFAQWLVNVGASTNVGTLAITESRHNVSVSVPPNAYSTPWLTGSYSISGTTYNAESHLTFNTPVNPPPLPDGDAGTQCGRVVFSDFHVSASARADAGAPFPDECKVAALTPQEKALVFMLYDLSSCIQKDNVPPAACSGPGGGCAVDGACCSGLSCLDPVGLPCNGGQSCTCGTVIQ